MPMLIVREAAISAGINAAISAGFFFAFFGLGARVPVWGLGSFAFDFMPQSFAVCFFASFVPSLLATKAAARGRVTCNEMIGSPLGLLRRSMKHGLAGLIIGGALWTALLWLAGVEQIAPSSALAIKIAYGFLLGGAVTARSLRQLLAIRQLTA